jgi:hypothetical protein
MPRKASKLRIFIFYASLTAAAKGYWSSIINLESSWFRSLLPCVIKRLASTFVDGFPSFKSWLYATLKSLYGLLMSLRSSIYSVFCLLEEYGFSNDRFGDSWALIESPILTSFFKRPLRNRHSRRLSTALISTPLGWSAISCFRYSIFYFAISLHIGSKGAAGFSFSSYTSLMTLASPISSLPEFFGKWVLQCHFKLF